MNKIIGIYKIVSPSGKIYIGQCTDFKSRIGAYRRGHCKSQSKLYASICKYGFENHKVEFLCECSKEELSRLEKHYVDTYQTFNTEHGLNIRDGGGNSAKLSDEQKAKISKTLTGVKHSPERIEKNRQAQLGLKRPPKSEETRRKLSIANKGKKLTEEPRKKRSEIRKGKPVRPKGTFKHSEETKQKLKELSSGINNPNYGKPRSEETRRKISESLKRRKQNT